MEYTIKELADKCRVSKTSVRRHIKKLEAQNGTEYVHSLSYITDNGTLILTEALAEELKIMIESTPQQQRIAEQLSRTAEQRTRTPEQESGAASHNGGSSAGTQNRSGGEVFQNGTPTGATAGAEQNNNATITALNAVIDTFKSQIEVLNEQLREKDKQIQELNARLASGEEALRTSQEATAKAQELLSQQQQLHAIDLKQNSSIESGADQEEKKLPFLKRLFTKK